MSLACFKVFGEISRAAGTSTVPNVTASKSCRCLQRSVKLREKNSTKKRNLNAHSAVGHTTPTGGWCYHTVNQTLISKDKQAVDKDYFLPLDHCAFDAGLAKAISKLFLKDGESVTDLGAGVGQAGHALRALLPKLDYRGYDGAGNVEGYTGGSVKFADLTLPMAVEVSDWVMSVEVGEHIPHEFEKDLTRNIHILNRKGVLLSWAHLGQGGKMHVNCHSPEYLHKIFAALGYEYDNSTAELLRLSCTCLSDASPRFTIWWRKPATPIPLPPADSPRVAVSRAET